MSTWLVITPRVIASVCRKIHPEKSWIFSKISPYCRTSLGIWRLGHWQVTWNWALPADIPCLRCICQGQREEDGMFGVCCLSSMNHGVSRPDSSHPLSHLGEWLILFLLSPTQWQGNGICFMAFLLKVNPPGESEWFFCLCGSLLPLLNALGSVRALLLWQIA